MNDRNDLVDFDVGWQVELVGKFADFREYLKGPGFMGSRVD